MSVLRSIDTYVIQPDDAWKRIKTRSNDVRFLGVVRSLARWREAEAQRRDMPRGRILKDDAILEIAANKPKTREQLLQSRSLQREGRKGETCDAILAEVERGLADPPEKPPAAPQRKQKAGSQAVTELLRVLLKAKADELGVAQRLIASSADLDALANDEPDVPALSGWRREAFGEDAVRLKRGELALSVGPKGVKVTEV